jgi:hypothetical protein
MKKAYLVTLSITTRVVVDVPEDNCNAAVPEDCKSCDSILSEAAKHIKDDPDGYLIWDNVDEVVEDTECPYGSCLND